MNQCARLIRLVPKEIHIVWQAFDSINLHSSAKPPQNRCVLVASKIGPVRARKKERMLRSAASSSRGRKFPTPAWALLAEDEAAVHCSKFYQSLRHLLTGNTQSTMPVASAGIPLYSASVGSCAIVSPPCSLIHLMPMAPSASAPESTIPIEFCPWASASVRRKEVHGHSPAPLWPEI